MTNKIDKIQMPDGQVLELNGGSGLEICDIGMALYVDESKGLRRYLNGQIVDINTNTQAFLNRLLQIQTTNPDYFTTENNWQAEATLNIDGCVYKFVLNYADDGETVVSVRLPKYPDYVEINAGGTLPVVGNGMALGLTNGTANGGVLADSTSKLLVYTGPYGQNVQNNLTGEGSKIGQGFYGVTSDATKSGLEATLNQTKLKMRYFIQIATGSETENNIINEIELNNPFSLFDNKYSDHELNNLSWLKSSGQWNAKLVYPTAYDKLLKVYNGTETVEGLSVKLSTEEYTDYDFVLNTAEETFRLPLLDGSEDLPSDTVIKALGTTTINATEAHTLFTASHNGFVSLKGMGSGEGPGRTLAVFKNGHAVGYIGCDLNSYDQGTVNFEVKRGDVVTVYLDYGSMTYNYEYLKAIGNGSLYYYVGETVQNANLIDAGRIGEQLANKTDMLQASGAGMPSNRYIDLTFGASGTTYTAPANGWLCIRANHTSSAYYNIDNNTSHYEITESTYTNYGNPSGIYPVKKGDIITISYGGVTEWIVFRFIYAEGEV